MVTSRKLRDFSAYQARKGACNEHGLELWVDRGRRRGRKPDAALSVNLHRGQRRDDARNRSAAPVRRNVDSCQVETDGVNGGKLELWDVDGSDGGADVNTAAAITNAQLTAAIAKGRARLVYEQSFLGTSGARLNLAGGMPIARGLAARFSNAGVAGTITLSIVSRGLFMKTQICG